MKKLSGNITGEHFSTLFFSELFKPVFHHAGNALRIVRHVSEKISYSSPGRFYLVHFGAVNKISDLLFFAFEIESGYRILHLGVCHTHIKLTERFAGLSHNLADLFLDFFKISHQCHLLILYSVFMRLKIMLLYLKQH